MVETGTWEMVIGLGNTCANFRVNLSYFLGLLLLLELKLIRSVSLVDAAMPGMLTSN